MSWLLLTQIGLLIILAYLFSIVTFDHVIEKRREDAIRRKEAGL